MTAKRQHGVATSRLPDYSDVRLTRSMIRYHFLRIPSIPVGGRGLFPPDRVRFELCAGQLRWSAYVASGKISRLGDYFAAHRLRVGDVVRVRVRTMYRIYSLEP
jgi:hypothetical protein